MRINSIGSTNFNGGVRIVRAENKECSLLYNKIYDLKKELKIPATFRTYDIELPSVTKDVIKKLNELGIKFNNI